MKLIFSLIVAFVLGCIIITFTSTNTSEVSVNYWYYQTTATADASCTGFCKQNVQMTVAALTLGAFFSGIVFTYLLSWLFLILPRNSRLSRQQRELHEFNTKYSKLLEELKQAQTALAAKGD